MIFRKKSSLVVLSDIVFIHLFILSLMVSCAEQYEYPFMVVGFPIDQKGIDIITTSGKPIDKLIVPWIFTFEQSQKSLLPLTYPLTNYSPWKEKAFVSADQITFCPKPTQGRWQSFGIHSAQISTLEGVKYKTKNDQVIFSIAIDGLGPEFEFVYQCRKNSIKVISRKQLFGW